ncbi:tRNA (N6-isopentenyl adenosine(37)-C2)-methylthiotransferase MiaB [Calderihabitans maritimus]|uniref:tRNA-2-methylthio-N(6)-dimethylallyladenosine synthase n=1 Tax=Calderihabitans maritimus TaxID=1246530 RepID=A0A1Z5HPP7_9FIRM|nr:tRNA (N6-isopentenyl adenosine(37)-C2)-methylthiotransferase MiaB [Calderihabitans maritimus]GAW91499.1 (dimethylallyl)adenosine tRNA methylthiotransferase MiaB [Calderihabitans maritimus]
MKYFIETWGCQMNERDTETIAGLLEEMGYSPGKKDEADVIILNTCCVREKAEQKVYGEIGHLRHLKSKNPNLVIGICGCMAQQEEVAEKMRQRFPHIDLIFGTHNIHQLPRLLERARKFNEVQVEIWEREGEIIEHLPARRADKFKAYVSVTYGCNNFCTYCIVPYVRGRERSRLPEDILKEIKDLVEQGTVEVMLLGQNVNSYGKDLDKEIDFADLLQMVDEVKGLRRIRYMTSHPRDFTDKLIATIAASDHVCEHFHLPVQAGSNDVLQKMNRGYTREQYMELVEKIRRQVPGASITTDIIVGFPGETEEDFQDTLDLVKKVQFDAAFTFLYSPRKGTVAAKMPDQIPDEVKKERFQRLLELQNSISLASNKRLVGSTVEVLVEGKSKTNPHKLSGRTRTNKVVIFEGPEEIIGKFVPIKITEAKTWNLEGNVEHQGEGG